jgi:hypothetical protein
MAIKTRCFGQTKKTNRSRDGQPIERHQSGVAAAAAARRKYINRGVPKRNNTDTTCCWNIPSKKPWNCAEASWRQNKKTTTASTRDMAAGGEFRIGNYNWTIDVSFDLIRLIRGLPPLLSLEAQFGCRIHIRRLRFRISRIRLRIIYCQLGLLPEIPSIEGTGVPPIRAMTKTHGLSTCSATICFQLHLTSRSDLLMVAQGDGLL